MPVHSIKEIFINLPITIAYQLFWDLINSSETVQSFNHYFISRQIYNQKAQSFYRKVSLRTNKTTACYENDSNHQKNSLQQKCKIEPQKSQQYSNDEYNLHIIQHVSKNLEDKEIIYQVIQNERNAQRQNTDGPNFLKNICGSISKPQQRTESSIRGQFRHRFQQNNKGETYLIFTSSLRNGVQCIPQPSEIEIQLIKIKDLLENKYHQNNRNKTSAGGFKLINSCCGQKS